jgi:hypothetical protein
MCPWIPLYKKDIVTRKFIKQIVDWQLPTKNIHGPYMILQISADH